MTRRPRRNHSAAFKAKVAIAAIKGSEEPLALADLAARTGYSPTHFQRVFTRHTGLSPTAYLKQISSRARTQDSD